MTASREQRWLRAVAAAVLAMALAYGVLLLPGVRTAPGYNAWIDGWLNGVVDLGVVVALVVRGLSDRRQRAGWLFLAGGLLTAFLGSIAYYAHYQHLDAAPSPSWSDAGWLAFYPLMYVGLLLLLRARVQRLLPSLWLDGLVAGLTVAAVAVAYLHFVTVPSAGAPGQLALALAYPVGDLLLLALGVAALAMLGRRADTAWWAVCAGLVAFATTDAVYAAQLAADTYVAGGVLDLGWLLARLCLLGGAVVSAVRPSRGQPVRLEGASVLALPGLCALVAMAVLFHGTRGGLPEGSAILALLAGAAGVARAALTFREVRYLAEARRQARTDELTGLANRRHFLQVLDDACAGERRCPLAVLLLDLDRFKEVNDSLGHQVGDDLLRQVAMRLVRLARPEDVLARLGGDEYALLVPGVTADDAQMLAWRVRTVLQQPIELGSATVTIDASVGIALSPEHAGATGELLQVADLAMYAAKASGRGVLLYDEERDGAGRQRLELVAQLREGIDARQLVLHYQPQLDLREGRVTGVEALVRWQHPTRGLLGPQAFLDLAESAGLMGRLTREVLEAALRQCRRWRDQGLPLRVAVNVSPSALVDNDFPVHVELLLAEHGLPADSLVLEVTEELFLRERDRAVAAVARLRQAGVRVAVDDYGTGYSSLAYLQDLPVTELKLDRAFVAGMTSSSRSAAIVSSTVALAHALGLELVAEGVEDVETLEALRAAGCDLVQGFLLGRPAPADQVAGSLLEVAVPASPPAPSGG